MSHYRGKRKEKRDGLVVVQFQRAGLQNSFGYVFTGVLAKLSMGSISYTVGFCTGGAMSDAKSLAVAKYILERQLSRGDTVSPMQLIKLVYIAHGFMLGKHGTPLLSEDVEAWQYGPVVRSVYDAVKEYRSSPVREIKGDTGLLAVKEREILDMVADDYAKHSGVVLSSATHKAGTPWHRTWEKWGKNATISNDLIEHFYADLLSKEVHSAL